MKRYHGQGSQLNDSNHGIDFFYGEKNYHQVGNGYLEFYITLKNGGSFNNIVDGNVDEPIGLVNIAFPYAFSAATPSTTGGKEIEQNKYVGHVSTIVRLSTSKDGDLISYFDKIDAPQNGIKGLSLNHILIDHHVEAAERKSYRSITTKVYFWIS